MEPCVFLRKYAIVLVYVDDCIIVSKDSHTIEDLVISLKTGPGDFLLTGPGDFLLTDEVDIEYYLGVEISPLKGDTFELCQPYLIKTVLDLLDLPHSVKGHSRPANKKLFYRDDNGPSWKYYWHYRSAVGMLSYMQGLTRPDISMEVHQCARFSNNP